MISIISQRGEEELLGRSFYRVVQEGKALQPYIDAMKEASENEWDEFKRAEKIEPVRDPLAEARKLMQFGSGLINTNELKKWVLGETQPPGNSEIKR